VVATSDAKPGDGGSFTIGYQFHDLDPDTVIAAMSQAERDAYYNRKRIIEEETIEETQTFWYFIVFGVVGFIIVVVLIICLVRLKKHNDLIVAKVEKLEVGAKLESDDEKNDDFYNS